MHDLFTEVWESVRRNKLRTCLTGFAVAWGIFMIIVLLGAGNGLMGAFNQGGNEFVSNSMMIGGGSTSKPYKGLKEGRRIRLEMSDMNLMKQELLQVRELLQVLLRVQVLQQELLLREKRFRQLLQLQHRM